ncbi:MAG: hypothetical protein ACK5OB_03135 [Pirellula sp.]
MKFWGLILICASSALALLLPALGVVRFPMGVSSAMATPSSAAPTPPMGAAVGNAADPPSLTSGPQWPQSMMNGDASASLPPSLNTVALGNQGAAAEATGSVANPGPTNDARLGRIPFTHVNSQKVGLGVWVCLIPVMLVGLGMWTFSPSPRRAK